LGCYGLVEISFQINNPLPPSDAVRKQKKYGYFIGFFRFSIVTIQKISHPRNLKLGYLGIFQSLKLRILMEKILPTSQISLQILLWINN